MTMLEQIAKRLFEGVRDRAIANHLIFYSGAPKQWSEIGEPAWKEYRAQARMVLVVMREPTEAMCAAVSWGPALEADWRKMVDAALGE